MSRTYGPNFYSDGLCRKSNLSHDKKKKGGRKKCTASESNHDSDNKANKSQKLNNFNKSELNNATTGYNSLHKIISSPALSRSSNPSPGFSPFGVYNPLVTSPYVYNGNSSVERFTSSGVSPFIPATAYNTSLETKAGFFNMTNQIVQSLNRTRNHDTVRKAREVMHLELVGPEISNNYSSNPAFALLKEVIAAKNSNPDIKLHTKLKLEKSRSRSNSITNSDISSVTAKKELPSTDHDLITSESELDDSRVIAMLERHNFKEFRDTLQKYPTVLISYYYIFNNL